MNNLRSSTIQYQEEKTSSNSSSRNSRPATRTAYFQLKTKKKRKKKKRKISWLLHQIQFLTLYMRNFSKIQKTAIFFFLNIYLQNYRQSLNPIKDWQFKALGYRDLTWNENVKNSSSACSIAEISSNGGNRGSRDPGEVTIAVGSVLRAVERTTARSSHRWQRTGSKIRVF